MLCKNISKSVLAIEKMAENSTKNSFQDHLGNLHGEKKSGISALSRPSTNVPKMNPNLAPPRPQSLKPCITMVLSRPLRMDLKKTLLSRPLQTGLITLTLNTWYQLMRQLKSFQIPRPEGKHSQLQNSCPAVCLLQDHDSTPSTWSQDQ